jgi:hypothetical protein
VQEHVSGATDAQAKAIIKVLLKDGRLVKAEYTDKKTGNRHKALRRGAPPNDG